MENAKSVASTRGAKVWRGRGVATPLNFGGGSRGGGELPQILRDFFLIDDIIMLLCTGYFYRGGGGGLAPLQLIQLYSLCIFISIGNLNSGLFIAQKFLNVNLF